MESTYRRDRIERYKNRLYGLKREKAIYEYVLENVGAKVIRTKLMRKFGFAVYGTDADNFTRTRLDKYTTRTFVGYSRRTFKSLPRAIYARHINDVIWLPMHLVKEHRITTLSAHRWEHWLCYKNTAPFWLFSEYGGPYTGREFITKIDKIVKELEGHMSYELRRQENSKTDQKRMSLY